MTDKEQQILSDSYSSLKYHYYQIKRMLPVNWEDVVAENAKVITRNEELRNKLHSTAAENETLKHELRTVRKQLREVVPAIADGGAAEIIAVDGKILGGYVKQSKYAKILEQCREWEKKYKDSVKIIKQQS